MSEKWNMWIVVVLVGVGVVSLSGSFGVAATDEPVFAPPEAHNGSERTARSVGGAGAAAGAAAVAGSVGKSHGLSHDHGSAGYSGHTPENMPLANPHLQDAGPAKPANSASSDSSKP